MTRFGTQGKGKNLFLQLLCFIIGHPGDFPGNSHFDTQRVIKINHLAQNYLLFNVLKTIARVCRFGTLRLGEKEYRISNVEGKVRS